VRPDELHTAFTFDFVRCDWDADALRAVIARTLEAPAAVGAPATWVLSNHDVVRHVTRSPASPGVRSFAREPGFACVVNLSAERCERAAGEWPAAGGRRGVARRELSRIHPDGLA
jgi:hypothetical protein